MSNKPLTPLEAALLGLYKRGARWIAKDNCGSDISELWGYSNEPYIEDGFYYNSFKCEANDVNSTHSSVHGCECLESLGFTVDEPLEILPWLTTHGITPPDVEA